jgi:hypothetical protein
MMLRRSVYLILALAFGFLAASCSEDKPNRKPTTKVTGKVTVDGATPDPPVQVECIAASETGGEHATFSRCDTKPDGSFELSTYESGDGVPAGEYTVTFKWQPFNLMSRDYGPDKFKGKYAKPESSTVKFTIADGDPPKDLGTIDLTTKK